MPLHSKVFSCTQSIKACERDENVSRELKSLLADPFVSDEALL